LRSPNCDERDVAIELLGRCQRSGAEIMIGDKGYASRDFAATVTALQATLVRPRRKEEPAADHSWRRSANASRASSGPSKTC
jgi:hypothetical protein